MGTEPHPPVSPKAEPERLGVVLVEPIQLVRAGLSLLIEGEQDMEVLIQASSADECLGAIKAMRRRSGVVVLLGVPAERLGAVADGLDMHRDADDILTEREREVLSIAAEGLTARQIGHRLGLRERTVTTHLARIYRKLGAPGRVAAINFAA